MSEIKPDFDVIEKEYRIVSPQPLSQLRFRRILHSFLSIFLLTVRQNETAAANVKPYLSVRKTGI